MRSSSHFACAGGLPPLPSTGPSVVYTILRRRFRPLIDTSSWGVSQIPRRACHLQINIHSRVISSEFSQTQVNNRGAPKNRG